MYDLRVDTDNILSEFINDYVEGALSACENVAFEEYISTNEQISSFVYKSKQGKRALKNANSVSAAEDFEEKLAQRIAQESSLTKG